MLAKYIFNTTISFAIFILCFFSVPAFALKPEFSLYNTKGEKVTEENLHGHYSLIFFGYRHCPNTCPVSLSVMANAMKSLKPEVAKKVLPVFVSVDSKRDSAEALQSYAQAFHPKMMAMMGSPKEIKKAAYSFKVFYSKQLSRDPNNYEISHSSSTYLLGPSGELLKRYAYGTRASVILKDLQNKLGA